jgi:O-antigen/teichoic acid export membrane protein
LNNAVVWRPSKLNLLPEFIQRRVAHRPNLLKIVDNIGWLFFDKVLRMGVGLVVGVWIARYLGPEQFGLLSFATAFIGLFGAVAGLGLQGIVVRDLIRNPAGKEETLGTAAGLLFGGGLLAYGLILGVILVLRPEDTLSKTLVAILGSTMLFKASEGAVYWFESQVLSKYTVWVQNGSFLIFAAIKIVLILGDAPLVTFAWAAMAEALLVATLLLVMLGVRGPNLRQWRFSLVRAKGLMMDSWPLLLSGIAISVYMKIDQIMLGQIIGDDAVGIYSAAVYISEAWYFTIAIVLASLFPTFAQLHAKNSEILRQLWVKAYRLMFFLSVAVAFTVAFASGSLVEILFGDDYISAAPVLSIHVWAGVNVAVGSVWSKWILLENKLRVGLYGHVIGAVVNMCLNLLFIPEFGPIGAAVATLVSYWFSALVVYSLHKPFETYGLIFEAISFRRASWS